MVLGVVRDHHHATAAADAGLVKLFHKFKKGQTVELVRLPAKLEAPIAQPHGAKISHAVPGGMMPQHRVLGFRRHPHPATGTVLLEVHFVGGPQVYRSIGHQRLEFFLWVCCRSGSAQAIAGRGLRKRKPNCRNKRWHCRTPKLIPYCRSIQAARVLPSHRLPPRPSARGICRRAALTCCSCLSLSRRGRPPRSPSRSPANPSSSNPPTQELWWPSPQSLRASCLHQNTVPAYAQLLMTLCLDHGRPRDGSLPQTTPRRNPIPWLSTRATSCST